MARVAGELTPRPSDPPPLVHGRDRQIVPISRQIIDRHERAAAHPIHIEHALKVVNLMLQNASVPALGSNGNGLRFFIEALDASAHSARHQGAEPDYA